MKQSFSLFREKSFCLNFILCIVANVVVYKLIKNNDIMIIDKIINGKNFDQDKNIFYLLLTD